MMMAEERPDERMSDVLTRRKKYRKTESREETEEEEKEEEEDAFDQLLNLLGSSRRKRRKRKSNRPAKRDQYSSTSENTSVEQLLNDEDVREEEEEEEEEEGEVIGEEVSGNEEEVEEDVTDYFRYHFDRLLTAEEVQSLHSNNSLSPPSLSPPLGLVSFKPGLLDIVSCSNKLHSLSQLSIKQKLRKNWRERNAETDEMRRPSDNLTNLQSHLLPIIFSYRDLLYCQRSVENEDQIRRLYILHSLNHILKSKSIVLKNNHRLLQASKESQQMEQEPRDQSLTRPKILILLPFRHSALLVVNTIISLLLPSGQGVVHNQKRFKREYGGGGDMEGQRLIPKPSSYTAVFTGNVDDCFKIGISIKGKMVRLYTDFYSADMILASPLGLRTIIGAEGEKKRDYDFLSSVEVLVMDQTDVFLMQNWEHLTHVMKHLHLRPKEAHDTDYSRVRMWALNEWSHFYCQTIIISSLLSPEISSVFSNCHMDYSGGVRCVREKEGGSVEQVAKQLPQMFLRLSSSLSPLQLSDHRLHIFSSQILPGYHGDLMRGTLIFIPSYFDFVRIRNLMKKEEMPFVTINEYSTLSAVSRARTQFFQGLVHYLLYTERAHFFHRYRLKGVKHLVMYSLPTYSEHYSDLVNMVEGEDGSSVQVLYSRWEQQALSRVVGGVRAQQMITSADTTHMIVTGQHFFNK